MIDCNKITKYTKDLMLSLINRSDKENKEFGILLCENKGEITHSDICVGTSCLFSTEKTNCPINTTVLGDYHTHPKENKKIFPRPSHGDIVSTAGARYEGFCIGYRRGAINTVDCYDIKDKKILELGKTANKFLQKQDFDNYIRMTDKISDRLYELGHPRRIKEILNKNCSVTRQEFKKY